MVIKINVTNKRAALVGSPVIVCGNSGYTIEFTFDAEWSAESVRTARFVYVRDGSVQYQDVVFSGPTVQVPVLANLKEVRVGVFAGDLHTSTPALIPCERSIRCGTGAPEDPTPSQYDQIMALLSEDVVPHAAQHRAGGSDPLTAADVGARPNTWTPTAADVGARPNTWMPTPADIGAASNPNLLDNWYFADPVNQRGQTEYTGGYGIDRWHLSNANMKMQVADGYVALTNQGLSGGDFVQRIERDLTGNQVTCSLLTNDGVLYKKTCIVSGSSSFEKIADNVYMGVYASAEGFTAFRLYWNSAQETVIDVIAAKLELGDKQTLAHQDASGSWVLNEIPDKGMELAKCQRYYYQSWDGNTITSDGVLLRTAIHTARLTTVEFPVTMAGNPNVTIYRTNGTSGEVNGWVNGADVVTGVIAAYKNKKSFMPALVTLDNGAFTVGTAYALHYSASADL